MDFLEANEIPIVIAVFAVAIVAFLLFSKKPKGCIDPDNFREFKLVKRTQLSHNVAKFRFALPKPTSVLGLPIGQHISCRGKDSQGEEVIKPYTPTTLDSDVGYFELVIKMYPQGRMSHHFREMKEGDYMAVKGPKGRFKYRPGDVRAFGMIAGGSGITPMFQDVQDMTCCYDGLLLAAGATANSICGRWLLSLQVDVMQALENQIYCANVCYICREVTMKSLAIDWLVARAILEDESDKTKLDLIYANVTVDDILLKEELDTLATKYAGRFKVYYVLNQPPEGWTGGVGFVTKEMIAEHFPAPAFDIKILRCGPPPMNKAMAAHLEALGYGPELLFQF